MIPVVIEYRPIPFLPFRRTCATALPAHWYELTPDQLILIPAVAAGGIDETNILKVFLRIKKSLVKKLDDYYRLCLVRNLTYLSQIESCDRFIIPSIAGYKAPLHKLEGVIFGAFIFGDTYFESYMNGRKEDLNRFIACFYLKGSFTEKDLDARAARISREPIEKREAIALNYKLIREWLAAAYPYVFHKPEPGEKKKPLRSGWVQVFDMIVGDDIAREEKYALKPLSSTLRYLNRKTKENLKRK